KTILYSASFFRRLGDRPLSLHTAQCCKVLAVHEYLRPIVRLGNQKGFPFFDFWQGSAVEDTAVTLVKKLHGLYMLALYGFGQVIEDGSYFRNVNGWNRHGGNCFWNFTQGLPFTQVLLEQFAHFKKFGCGVSRFSDWCIVIVGCCCRREVRDIGPCPMAERGTARCHVSAKGYVLVEHFFHAADQLIGATCLMRCTPMIKPTGPKFAAHQWAFGTQFFDTAKLFVNIGSRTKVNRPKQVFLGVVLKIGVPIALKEWHIGEASTFYNIFNCGDVGFIYAIGTVFIFDLHHDDVAASVNL